MWKDLVIAGWFASPGIHELIVLAYSVKEHPVWWGMKKEFEELIVALELIQAFVRKIEKLQIIHYCSQEREAWLWQLKDAVDEVNDVLDKLAYYKLKENGEEKVSATASGYTKKIIRSTAFAFKHAIHTKKKLKRAVKNLVHVADSVGDFLEFYDLFVMRQHLIIAPESSSCLLNEKVFGREKEREKIVAWLKKPENKNVTILPIVGMAGIGKTTLAQLVYEDDDVKGIFDLRMWVCVSNDFDFDVTRIMKKIIQAATRELSSLQEIFTSDDFLLVCERLSTLQKILIEKLKSNKFLLVLDDVWNDYDHKIWEDLVAPLKIGKYGSKILLTTRMNSVAETIGQVMEGTKESMNLQGIEWNQYLSLFNKHAFAGVNPDDHEELQLIGNQIAKKLGQSPLVAKTMGAMLNSNMSSGFWKEILGNGVFNSIQDKDFQMIPTLSYLRLPPQLQHCFRYCSIFPQDYLFEKHELVRMWMAARLIHPDGKKSAEDIGGEYFDSLLRKSFFYRAPAPHRVGTNAIYYVIHHLLHEMVCSISQDECLLIDYSKPNPRDNPIDIPTTLRHLSIIIDHPLTLRRVPRLENLHTLILWIHDYFRWDDVLNKVLKGFKNLRVLKLESSATCKHGFLNAIGDLKHLRYLYLDNIVPKSVNKLYHLQTMIVLRSDPSTKSIRKVMRRSLIKSEESHS